MASRYWSQESYSESEDEVINLEDDIAVGGGKGGASKCEGRRTDAAVKSNDKDDRPELCDKITGVEFDQSSKKRSRLHKSLRRDDDTKRSRLPFARDSWTRQAGGRAESYVVNMQPVYMRDDAFEVPPRKYTCEAPHYLPSMSHVDIPGFEHSVNRHRTSWRDGATDSMTNCMFSSGGTPELGMRCLEMVTARDAGSACAAVHAEFEFGNGFVHVSGERAEECTLDTYSDGESGLPHQIGVPLEDLHNEINSVQRPPSYPLLGELVSSLKKGEDEYKDIESKFLSGLGKYATDTVVTGICRDTSPRGQARLQAFEKLEESTRKARGDANVRFAWHGTSKTGVSGIFLHGFGQPRTPKNGSAYGVGVYLAPEGLSRVSAVYADNDENNEQHVVLCRVILGSSELVNQGSDQFHPSSEKYDSGVDDLVSPKRLIVWSTHMNTHILPLYVVSFRLPPRWHLPKVNPRERPFGLFGSARVGVSPGRCKSRPEDIPLKLSSEELLSAFHGKRAFTICRQASMKRYCTARQECPEANDEKGTALFCKQGPTSPAISFPHLFLLLTPLLTPDRLQYLRDSYQELQGKRLSRSKFIQHLREEVGVERLVHAIKLLQGSQIPKDPDHIKHETSQRFQPLQAR